MSNQSSNPNPPQRFPIEIIELINKWALGYNIEHRVKDSYLSNDERAITRGPNEDWELILNPEWDNTAFEFRIQKTKKTGWVNIYKNNHCSGKVHPSKDDADMEIITYNNSSQRVSCIQIKWEE